MFGIREDFQQMLQNNYKGLVLIVNTGRERERKNKK